VPAALRRARSATAALRIAAGCCVLLGWIAVAVLVWTTGHREILAVRLLTLYSVAAFIFAWGWRIEAVLIAATVVPAIAALPRIQPSDQPNDVLIAVALGTVIALAVAELAARGLANVRAHRRAAEDHARELAASRDAYRDLAENVRDFIWAIDLDGRWTYMNTAFERFFGIPRQEMMGRSARELLRPHPLASDVTSNIARVMAGETLPELRFVFDLPSGQRWVEALASAVYDQNGTMIGVRGVSRDITERVVLDTQLRESEAKFRMLAEAIAIPVFLVQGTRNRYINAAAVRMLGYSEAELLAMPFWEILHPEDQPIVRARAEARQQGAGAGLSPSLEYRVVTKAGEVRWVDFTAVLIEYEGKPTILGTAVDMTERKRAETALHASLEDIRQSEERLRRLARRQVAIREDERKRIGFDLHDGVCQELIGVGILIASARERLPPDARESMAALVRAIAYLNDVVEHLRVLARELRPMLLHDLGLEVSLGSLAAGHATPDRPVEARFATPIPRLAEEVELAVYRIAQEALTNAVRHADARSIVITVTVTDGALRCEVRDDGRGFDPRSRHADALGIAGMQERATALGARLTIESTPGGGTTVTLEWRPADVALAHRA
jgi:PAS domain S-box-containing protein